MELCKDCGHKNVGVIYCTRCGSALFSRKRDDRAINGPMAGFTRLLTLFSKRN